MISGEAYEAFAGIVGPSRLTRERAALELMSQDVWAAGEVVSDLVLSPQSTLELSRILAETQRRGFAVAIRGGGLSYTGGYIPTRERTVTLDLRAMNRVLQVDPDNMTVTVEAGCTWKSLLDALGSRGLRTPFWGPLSGLTSTVGGGVSQLNAVFGAGQYGTTSESVIGLTIVLADGNVLHTGARGTGPAPFYRHYGPDLTGLFCGDCGSLGVKAEITLRLIRAPAQVRHGSFVFATAAALIRAATEITRAGFSSELLAFDPSLGKMLRKRATLGAGLTSVRAVAASGRSWWSGVKAAVGVAAAGRAAIDADHFALHITMEGRHGGSLEADLGQARRIVSSAGGREIQAALPTVLRARPFAPPNSVLGPDGERWVPVHGIVSLADADPCFAALQTTLAAYEPRFTAAQVTTGFLMATLSTNAFLIEPVFYWPEARRAIHEATVEPALLASLPRYEENANVTALVSDARLQIIETFQRFGAAHFQVGRTYPWLESLDPQARHLANAVKNALDPAHQLSPGGLGFAP